MFRFRIACCLLLAASGVAATGAPSTTAVRDKLTAANGSAFSGIMQVDWKGFRAADGTEVAQGSLAIPIVNGFLNVRLIPTTNADRAVFYTVRYNSNGRTQFSETWAVPPTSATLRVSDVRTHAVSSSVSRGATAAPLTVITVQDVSGLRTELDLRPTRGATWMAGRAAVIGATGAIESAIGSAEDCVRVDGSSGPCGSGTGGIVYTDNETPSGVVDGVNTVFSLSNTPLPVASLNLFRNGMLVQRGTEYTQTGASVTFAPGSAPRIGDVLTASYRIDPAEAVGLIHADAETPVGAANGVNAEFTLSGVPAPAASLQLYRNGLLQKAGLDYTLAVNQIRFLTGAIPQSGDTLQAMYRK